MTPLSSTDALRRAGRSASRSAGRGVRGASRTVQDSVQGAARSARSALSPRRGARRSVLGVIGQLPHYARLLAGLMTDRRVSKVDKALVGLALAYLLLPLDFIPDAIPFLGQVDDVFLLMTALQRLVDRSGRRVLRAHWTGSRADLRKLDIAAVASAAAFFLPGRMKRNLTGLLTGAVRGR